MLRLLVYGTLRKGGYYHHLIKEAHLIQEGIRVKGYEIRDSGMHYPYAFESPEREIIGDIYEVSQALLEGPLDELEDVASGYYKRYFDTINNFYIYIKASPDRAQYPLIASGDWLKYWEEKS